MAIPVKDTRLGQICIVGPPRFSAEAKGARAWVATLGVATEGMQRGDKSIVNSTQGLRVLLQESAPSQAVPGTSFGPSEIRLHVPHLLSASVHAARDDEQKLYWNKLSFAGDDVYDLLVELPGQSSAKGPSHDLDQVIVSPARPWPYEVDSGLPWPEFVAAPPVHISEGRIRVLVRVEGGVPQRRSGDVANPTGFLRLAKLKNNPQWVAAFTAHANSEQALGHRYVALDAHYIGNDGPYIAVELTSEGVEFAAYLPDPRQGKSLDARIGVILRLVCKASPLDPRKEEWSLEYVDDRRSLDGSGGGELREALRSLDFALRGGQGAPIVVDIDSERDLPAVRWPLDYRVTKTGGGPALYWAAGNQAWKIEIDTRAVRAALEGARLQDGELPTAASLTPGNVWLSSIAGAWTFGIFADRRASGTTEPVAGPQVTLRWSPLLNSGDVVVQLLPANNQTDLSLFLDQTSEARNAVDRYRSVGVLPSTPTESTFVFLPIDGDGWVQLALDLPRQKKKGVPASSASRRSVPFDGSLEYSIPFGGGPTRRIAIDAGDRVRGIATISPALTCDWAIEVNGAEGTLDGVIFLSTSCPSSVEILPGVDNGSAALRSPRMRFAAHESDSVLEMLEFTTSGFEAGQPFTLSLARTIDGKAPNLTDVIWRRAQGMPVASAIAMTRTSGGSGVPSTSRDLLGYHIEARQKICALVFDYPSQHGIPSLRTIGADERLLEPFTKVPLAAVTLPGVEFEASTFNTNGRRHRLRYDLPALDELFASARLPEKESEHLQADRRVAVEGPTALDPDGLLTEWNRAIDRLCLSATQESTVYSWRESAKRDTEITTLLDGAKWMPAVELRPTTKVGASSYTFGEYQLDDDVSSGAKALEGLSGTFSVTGQAMVRTSDGSGNLAVAGFATSLVKEKIGSKEAWRDTRNARSAVLPETLPGNGKKRWFVRAVEAPIDSGKSLSILRVTASEPVALELPVNSARRLALWFRDLPMIEAGNKLKFDGRANGAVEAEAGPIQEAFDKTRLPFGLYEWRLCNDSIDAAKSSTADYAVAIGPFRFRPLRLMSVDIPKDPNSGFAEASATIVGSLGLAKATVEEMGVPFGTEDAYATGNLIAITLGPSSSTDALTFAKAKLRRVSFGDGVRSTKLKIKSKTDGQPLTFRLNDVALALGDEAVAAQTTACLKLSLAEEAGDGGALAFRADGATLDVVLFGRRRTFEGGEVKQNGTTLTVSFTISGASPSKSGIDVSALNLVVDDRQAKLAVFGVLAVDLVDAGELGNDSKEVLPGAVQFDFGSGLDWLNLHVERKDIQCDLDNRRGRLRLRVRKNGFVGEPIAGLKCYRNDVVTPEIATHDLWADLVMVTTADGGTKGFFPHGSGLGRLALYDTVRERTWFRQRIEAKRADVSWTSEIMADIEKPRSASPIEWPLNAVPDDLSYTYRGGTTQVARKGLSSAVSGRVLSGSIAAASEPPLLTHTVAFRMQEVPVPVASLVVLREGGARAIVFGRPFSCLALVDHELTNASRSLSWRSLEHVWIVDARELLRMAVKNLDLSSASSAGFATVYSNAYERKRGDIDARLIFQAGILRRAFAQAGFPVHAMEAHLVEGLTKDEVANQAHGLVMFGAAPAMVRLGAMGSMSGRSQFSGGVRDEYGVQLSLPWLWVEVDGGSPVARKLARFPQAQENLAISWDAPDIDWATGDPVPMARSRPWEINGLELRSKDLLADLTRTMTFVGGRLTASTPVEQLFLRTSNEIDNVPIAKRPLWLRSLIALKTVWESHSAGGELTDRMVFVLPSAEAESGLRVSLVMGGVAPKADAQVAARLVAFDRGQLRGEIVSTGGGLDEVTRLARGRGLLTARASRLVPVPVEAILVIEDTATEPEAWEALTIKDDMDDGVLDIGDVTPLSERVYSSPALGWPTATGTKAASGSALGMGDDQAFQDGPEGSDGFSSASGLAGRSASLSLPAEASRKEEGIAAPGYYAIGRKVLFSRVEKLPLRTPPARYLAPHGTRVVVPTIDATASAFRKIGVLPEHLAPLVAPFVERTSIGLRPGTLQAEFDSMIYVRPTDMGNLDKKLGRFGRPGHVGPMLVRQQRSPRGVEFPRLRRDELIARGRRTFLALDDVDGNGEPRPFRLFSGVGTVLRGVLNNEPVSFHVRALDVTLATGFRGPIRLSIQSPSFKDGNALLAALGRFGLLRTPLASSSASLTIAGRSIDLEVGKPDVGSTFVVWPFKLSPEDLPTLHSEIERADGDTVVTFMLQSPKADSDVGALIPEEDRRLVTLRLACCSLRSPTLKVAFSTIVFGDPSYDRVLSGPGACSDIVRNKEGAAWKLASDRFEYGVDTPIYFAFGRINVDTGRFIGGEGPPPKIKFERQPASSDQETPRLELIRIAGVKDTDGWIDIAEAVAYSITLDRFRNDEERPPLFADGDQIVMTVASEKTVSCRVRVVARPIIAPPSAVYSVVSVGSGGESRTALHVTGPLPQQVEIHNLLEDLARGHIRRQALFVWRFAALASADGTGAIDKAALVKVDRSGGGQLPSFDRDILSADPMMEIKGGPNVYKRDAAVKYAREYWSRICSDGYIGMGSRNPPYGAFDLATIFQRTGVPDPYEQACPPHQQPINISEIDDCAHFISCCIGKPPGGTGGGLDIGRDFPNAIYGIISANKLYLDLTNKGLITVVGTQLSEAQAEARLYSLQAGDLIFYWDPKKARYGHVGMYMADFENRISCHTYCRGDQATESQWNSVHIPNVKYTLVKIDNVTLRPELEPRSASENGMKARRRLSEGGKPRDEKKLLRSQSRLKK